MSGGLSFDGGKSVKGASTGWTPNPTESFVVEAVIKKEVVGSANTFGCQDTTSGKVFLGFTSAGAVYIGIGNIFPISSDVSQIAHVVIKYDGTVGGSVVYINGIIFSHTAETSFTTPASPFYIGSLGTTQKTITIGTAKIHKGTQYAKFNIAKSWTKAQKIIAKLGA
jgi:hypothetical protein